MHTPKPSFIAKTITICAAIPPSKFLHPKLTLNPLNTVASSPLRPHISLAGHFLHWMTAYGLKQQIQLTESTEVNLKNLVAKVVTGVLDTQEAVWKVEKHKEDF